MLKLLIFATFVTVASAAPGLFHGVPSITSSSSSVVHSTVLAPAIHAAVLPAPALHGLSFDIGALHEAPVLSAGVLHSGVIAAPVSVLGHGILDGSTFGGLGLHGLH